MFKNLKTSTKVSLKFTVFTILIVMFFGVLANVFFFQGRYHKAEKKHNFQMEKPKFLFGNKFKKKIIIPKNSPEHKLFQGKQFYKKIYRIEDTYFFLTKNKKNILVQNITPEIKLQIDLFYSTFWLILIFGVLSYVVSRYFVKSSLKGLNNLIHHLQKSDLDNLKPIPINGNPNDEINIVGVRMNNFLNKINKQSLALKDFVANVSHELRTPMMNINSEIDYSLKSKKYKTGLENTKNGIKTIDTLLEELFLLTKISSEQTLKMEKNDIAPVIEKISKSIQKNYPDKKIILNLELQSSIQIFNRKGFEIIIRNLVANAFKYTKKGEINISNDKNGIKISDTGIGIEKKNIEKIRDRFWQVDQSRSENKGFGLGLYLVQTLIKQHKRNITVVSKKGEGTTFEVSF